MARGRVVAVPVVVVGLFLASVALGVAADDVMTFSSEVSSGDSAVAFNPNQQESSPSPTPPASPPPTPPAAPPPATLSVSPATPPESPPAPPAAPPPATPPVSPPTSPAMSPSSGSCPADYSKNFNNTFQIHTDTQHVIVGADGDSAELILDVRTAAVFGSIGEYFTGRFSANVKLPCGNNSGTVFAFYLSSNGSKPDHDEIDIEILGNTTDLTYTLQTNIFVDGQGNREMRHNLEWFEPCQDYHNYFIHWNNALTIIGVDDVPLRVFYNLENKGIPYFNKGQAMWVSYWDGSKWATQGGKYKIDYEKNGPFIADINSFHDLQACEVPWERDVTPCQNPSTPFCWDTPTQLSAAQQSSMQSHQEYCTYNYCTDTERFKDTGFPADCKYQNM